MKITELHKNSCRYIEGEANKDSDYCGRETVPTTPWCIKHLREVTPKAEIIISRELTKWENEKAGIKPEVRIAGKMTDKESDLEDDDITEELV